MLNLKSFFITLPLIASSLMLSALPSKAAESPGFEKYPAANIYKGKPASVKLNSASARQFRTVLRNGAKQGPNFAGYYTVVTWGCGSACQMIGIVNAKNGTVYMPGISASAGVKHQLNSNLLVVNPPDDFMQGNNATPPSWLKTRYYVWQSNRLVQVNSSTSSR